MSTIDLHRRMRSQRRRRVGGYRGVSSHAPRSLVYLERILSCRNSRRVFSSVAHSTVGGTLTGMTFSTGLPVRTASTHSCISARYPSKAQAAFGALSVTRYAGGRSPTMTHSQSSTSGGQDAHEIGTPPRSHQRLSRNMLPRDPLIRQGETPGQLFAAETADFRSRSRNSTKLLNSKSLLELRNCLLCRMRSSLSLCLPRRCAKATALLHRTS